MKRPVGEGDSRWHVHRGMFTALLLRRKYLLWRCALACERLRCEPWEALGMGGDYPRA